MASKREHYCSYYVVAQGKLTKEEQKKALLKAEHNKTGFAQGTTKTGVKWVAFGGTFSDCILAHPEILKRGLKGRKCK